MPISSGRCGRPVLAKLPTAVATVVLELVVVYSCKSALQVSTESDLTGIERDGEPEDHSHDGGSFVTCQNVYYARFE